jgi:hypothetical protein
MPEQSAGPPHPATNVQVNAVTSTERTISVSSSTPNATREPELGREHQRQRGHRREGTGQHHTR